MDPEMKSLAEKKGGQNGIPKVFLSFIVPFFFPRGMEAGQKGKKAVVRRRFLVPL